jgi:hypothetical protein
MYLIFCVFCSIVLLCVLFVSKCAMYAVLLPPSVNPIAVNKYVITIVTIQVTKGCKCFRRGPHFDQACPAQTEL